WRWSAVCGDQALKVDVLSTHVEVVRGGSASAPATPRALHARGGGPAREVPENIRERCSPRTWRWSGGIEAEHGPVGVLSTHVEVVRAFLVDGVLSSSALHARGGDSPVM